MKATLESTSKIVTFKINGVDVPARIWEGHTAAGVKFHAYITRVAVHEDLDASQFEKELVEHAKPSAEIEAIPLRMIL